MLLYSNTKIQKPKEIEMSKNEKTFIIGILVFIAVFSVIGYCYERYERQKRAERFSEYIFREMMKTPEGADALVNLYIKDNYGKK